MATAYRTSTPSPPPTSSIRTPPTPKHGFSDSWEPYSPRKSARIASQRTSHRTPSPQSSRRNRTPTRSSRKQVAPTNSIMSPTETPQKRRLPATESTRRTSGSLTAEGTSSAAHALGLDKQAKQDEESRTSTISRRSGMLPTPVKTPKKAPTEAQAASIRAVARNLFSHEEEASTRSPRKQRVPKRYNGISMESFVAEEVAEPIQIFTDSQDRVPEVDASAENPFYGNHNNTTPEAPRRRSKRKVTVPGEGSQQVEEALQREDGMIYVFRGKKIFRKFAENEDEDAEADDASLRVPLTRSSIKPRRLFQQQIQEVSPEDEEAVTDIEDHHMDEATEHQEEVNPQTPIAEEPEQSTPRAPRFAPAPTPPTDRRTTRFASKGDEATPSRPKGGRLFDNWPITKSRSSSAEVSHKRTAESSLPAGPAKRARA